MSSLTCDEVRDMLAARELALGLAPDGARALDEHLAACAPCREALLEAQDVSALLESALAEQADDACAQAARIAAALPVRGARRAAVRPRVSWAAVAGRVVRWEAAAALLLFGAGFLMVWWLQSGPVPAAAPGAPAPAGEQLPLRYVGSAGITGHEVLPDNRVRTQEVRRYIIMDPERPDLIIEVMRDAVIEEDLAPPRDAWGAIIE